MCWFLFALLYFYCHTDFVENVVMESKVFGGYTARPTKHKHLVKLEMFGPGAGYCSGSIISDKWIITSAHCVDDIKYATVSQDTAANNAVIATVQSKNIHVHPAWPEGHPSHDPNDIALIKTTKAIKFNEFVQPIKLARRHPKPGESAIIAGYGNSERGKPKPREGVVSISRCERYPNSICSDGIVWAGSGDSGGPLVFKGHLTGVTSAGCWDEDKQKQCETIYVSVLYHRGWIKRVVTDN